MTYTYDIVNRETTTRRTLTELTDEETEDRALIGKALGKDIGHCLYIAVRHHTGFIRKVEAYHLPTEVTPD